MIRELFKIKRGDGRIERWRGGKTERALVLFYDYANIYEKALQGEQYTSQILSGLHFVIFGHKISPIGA